MPTPAATSSSVTEKSLIRWTIRGLVPVCTAIARSTSSTGQPTSTLIHGSPASSCEPQPAAPGERMPRRQHDVERLAQQRHHGEPRGRGRGGALVAVGDDHVVVGGQHGTSGGVMSTSRQRRSTSGIAAIRRSSPASSIRAPDGNSAIRTSPLGRLRSPSTAA